MDDQFESLQLALTAIITDRTPARIAKTLSSGGRAAVREAFAALPHESAQAVEDQARELVHSNVHVCMYGDSDYPNSLVHDGRPVAPILFLWGDQALLSADGVGMCGSRAVSDLGLRAANACGLAVSQRGLVVVSGYAKGVDTATHLAALRSHGRTVIVLAEGINHFRIKRDFKADFDPDRVLVVSQFPPSQPWGAYAAMDRNRVIFGLSKALVVIEAGEKGGTLAAGEGALKIGRPLLVLDFGQETPAGNKKLLAAGGQPVSSVDQLGVVLDGLKPATESGQVARDQRLF